MASFHGSIGTRALWLGLCGSLLVSAAGAAAAAEVRYRAQRLGTGQAYGSGLNTAGQVSVWIEALGPSAYSAGSLIPVPNGNLYSRISGPGLVGLDLTDPDRRTGVIPSAYNINTGAVVPLTALPEDSYHVVVDDTNAKGRGIGRQADEGTRGRYFHDGVAEPAVPGCDGCAAVSINGEGAITGTLASVVDGLDVAYVRTAKGRVTELGRLPGDAWSSGLDINGRGDVVGLSANADNTVRRAFLWTGGRDRLQDLGTLGGSGFTAAVAINQQRDVVGIAETGGGEFRAFFKAHRGPMEDLNSLVPAADLQGWVLGEAVDINAAGQIVANGVDAALNTTAFLLTPVSPAAASAWRAAASDASDRAAPSPAWRLDKRHYCAARQRQWQDTRLPGRLLPIRWLCAGA